LALTSGAVAAALGGLAILGWVTPVRRLASIDPDYIPMAPSTALAFVLLGSAVLVSTAAPTRRAGTLVTIAASLLVSVVGAAHLVEFLVGRPPTLDEVLVPNPGRFGSVPSGRMSPLTAAGFLLAAAGLLAVLLGRARPAFGDLGGFLTSLVLLLSVVVTLGYSYGTPLLYGGATIPMALTTALGFGALGCGVIALAGPAHFPLRPISGTSTRARMLRAFLPIAPAVVVADGIFFHFVPALNPALHAALLALVLALIVTAGVAQAAHVVGSALDRVEEERRARAQAEAQLLQSQKMEAVGQLAGGIAHDFNNLLGVITGYADLLVREMEPGGRRLRRVEQIQKAASRAAELTRQLLAFGRKQVLQPRIVDLNTVVEDVEKMLRRLIGEDIQVITIFHAGLGRAKVDPAQIEQVIINLAVNARDAMPRGGKLIIETSNVELDENYVRSRADVRPGPQVMLAVSDTGQGMDAETASHIFEPFFTTKEKGKGTGLGLAMAYGVVRQSGGHITVYSEVGHGTTFKIYLPRTDEPEIEAAAAAPRAPLRRGSETVLLAEDEKELRAVIREILDEAGYAVIESTSVEAAISIADSHAGPIHLLVTDVVMPRMSGRELALRLEALRPEMKTLYVSGYTNEAIGHHGVLASGEQFLQKPFTRDSLLRKVREVLDAP
jgi:signal transduction histidine kinase/CheY-like chemotaxis protein